MQDLLVAVYKHVRQIVESHSQRRCHLHCGHWGRALATFLNG